MWTQTIFKLLALSLAGGIICGALWDVFKIPKIFFVITKSSPKNIFRNVVTFISDVFFCLVCACVVILTFYYGNEGNIRGIAVILMALGFWAYRVSVGTLVCFLSRKIHNVTVKVSAKLVCKIKKLSLKKETKN